MNAFITPTPVLRPRAESSSTTSYSTNSDGCVVCPSETASCPDCPSGQECNLKAQTCLTCPEYVCVDVESKSDSSSTPIGGIVGGVVGGVAVILLVLFLYYFLVYRKRHPRLQDDLDLGESNYEGMDSLGTISSAGEKGERPVALRTQLASSVTKNHRLSSYESFMRPPGYNKRGGSRAGAASGGRTGSLSVLSGTNSGSSPYGDNDMSKRNSVATTISTTNASNILPIAYIPGVTIRPTKNNTRSIYLYDTDSVFSDFAGIDNALIVQEKSGAHAKGTMTAIRAQPKLVNVERIEEDIEEEDEGELTDSKETFAEEPNKSWATSNFSSDSGIHNEFEAIAPDTLQWSDKQVDEAEHTDVDSDSDVDSDIGEIHRATSTRRTKAQEEEIEVYHDIDNASVNDSGSFVLDIGR